MSVFYFVYISKPTGSQLPIISMVVALIYTLSSGVLLTGEYSNTLIEEIDLQDKPRQYPILSSNVFLVPVIVFKPMLFVSVVGETDAITIDLVDLSKKKISLLSA
jgi:hypothetical protein